MQIITSVRIDGGFLDGVDCTFAPGLNTVIGARGTGKTSLIELIRFCLGARAIREDDQRSAERHALAVLGDGTVQVTLSDGTTSTIVRRRQGQDKPAATGRFEAPIVFAQTEIENVALDESGRLKLLDAFVVERLDDINEERLIASIRMVCDEIQSHDMALRDLESHLRQRASAETALAQLESDEESSRHDQAIVTQTNDSLTALGGESVRLHERATFMVRLAQRLQGLEALLGSAQTEAGRVLWSSEFPGEKEPDCLQEIKRHIFSADKAIKTASEATRTARETANEDAEQAKQQRVTVDATSHALRRQVEQVQEGAGVRIRALNEARARVAELAQYDAEKKRHRNRLTELREHRSNLLNRLEEIRAERFGARVRAAKHLNSKLGGSIRVEVLRDAQSQSYEAAVAETLRGSGMRYRDIAADVALKLSPREFVTFIEDGKYDELAAILGVSPARAARASEEIAQAGVGRILTARLEDGVVLQLLDGQDFKPLEALSTGQRCTVVLPIVMLHTAHVVLLDQPEDHLDNAFITDTLIRSIKTRGDTNGQLIISTHNANIPVLGDASNVVHLGSDGKRGFVVESGALQANGVVEAITSVMEGGREAFRTRAEFYDRKPQL